MRHTNKIELLLEGLHCAGCAAKIEAAANRLKNIDRASLNPVTNILAIEAANAAGHEQIVLDVVNLVRRIEPGVAVKNIKTEQGERKGMADVVAGSDKRRLRCWPQAAVCGCPSSGTAYI